MHNSVLAAQPSSSRCSSRCPSRSFPQLPGIYSKSGMGKTLKEAWAYMSCIPAFLLFQTLPLTRAGRVKIALIRHVRNMLRSHTERVLCSRTAGMRE
jgi:hypothetical protein